MRRLVAALLAIALLVLGAPSATADAGTEADFVARINGARSGRGLGGLAVDGELTAIARRWSQKMANDQRLSHNPNLSREVSHDWEKLAENVGYGSDVASIHEAFMNSATHRANILDGAMTHVGVGVVLDAAGDIWVTEVFMRLRGGGGGRAAPPPTTAAPTPGPAPAPAPAPTPTAPPTTTRPRSVATTAPPPPRP
ncbi:MAG TPA: CAP domain-containing protein, partial [Acidimicrobiales bacterium]|nr:CAP domain-containing protein [Acidimicrobiales bacterium]